MNYEKSTVGASHVIEALLGKAEFRHATHARILRCTREEYRARDSVRHSCLLADIVRPLSSALRRTILRAKNTGNILQQTPCVVKDTTMVKVEFVDYLARRYGHPLKGLPSHCDGCGQRCSVTHALECRKGGNIIARHNDVKYAVSELAIKAICPTAVRDEPLINPCRPATQQVAPTQPATRTPITDKDLRGDLLIKNLWDRNMDAILDICVVDTDANSHITRDPAKVLEGYEKLKIRKYAAACKAQRRTFTPFVVSVDGLLGRQAKTFLQRLSGLLAKKWERPYATVCGYVRASISFAIMRATHRCIRGSRIPVTRVSTPLPQWEDQAGLGFYQF